VESFWIWWMYVSVVFLLPFYANLLNNIFHPFFSQIEHSILRGSSTNSLPAVFKRNLFSDRDVRAKLQIMRTKCVNYYSTWAYYIGVLHHVLIFRHFQAPTLLCFVHGHDVLAPPHGTVRRGYYWCRHIVLHCALSKQRSPSRSVSPWNEPICYKESPNIYVYFP
jgi:hypothetical protein